MHRCISGSSLVLHNASPRFQFPSTFSCIYSAYTAHRLTCFKWSLLWPPTRPRLNINAGIRSRFITLSVQLLLQWNWGLRDRGLENRANSSSRSFATKMKWHRASKMASVAPPYHRPIHLILMVIAIRAFEFSALHAVLLPPLRRVSSNRTVYQPYHGNWVFSLTEVPSWLIESKI